MTTLTITKMTLAKALRYKKRIAQQIAKISAEIPGSNSYIEGAAREIDTRIALDKRRKLVQHLTHVKVVSCLATLPIQEAIFQLAELKAEIALINSLNTTHGFQRHHFSTNPTEGVKHVAVIRKQEQDQMVTAMQDQIDELQVKIDQHNNATIVDVMSLDVPDEYITA